MIDPSFYLDCVMDGPALLIDARNALYRAIHATKSDTRHQVKYHYFVIFLRQLTKYMNHLRPSSVHIFWDAPRETIWRRAALATYKDRSQSQYVEDISEELKLTSDVAYEFFKFMNVRQYSRKSMEADDLIFAATTILHPHPTIIVSTDSDMIQIPYVYNSSQVYDPTKRTIVKVPDINPVWQKALVGDRPDSIDGYYGIGPKKSAILLENHEELRNFLKTEGSQRFYLNLLLIDLSLCPRLLKNKIYVQRRLSEQVQFCSKKINELTIKHKVQGLLQEFNTLVPPFQKLG